MYRQKRTEVISNAAGLAVTLGIAFLAVIVLIFILSKTPVKTIYYFFIGPFTKSYYFGNMLNRSIPLILTGLGIAVAFRASVFNLGGEGQIYSGALAATVMSLWLPKLPGIVGVIIGALVAISAGAFLAGLSGFFRMQFGTDELISSFLISSAIVLIVNYFITGPLDDPASNLLSTRIIPEQYRLLKIFPPSKLDISIGISAVIAVLTYFFLFRTHWGYELRMCGLNRNFARYGGISVKKYLLLPMVISGGFHGLSGSLAVYGT